MGTNMNIKKRKYTCIRCNKPTGILFGPKGICERCNLSPVKVVTVKRKWYNYM